MDLGAFFRQILESVEPFYHEKMATTLLISLDAREPAPLAVYSFHDDEYDDDDYALKLPISALPGKQATVRREQMTRRLNGRCRGLLEVSRRHRVEFLHRSVMDYLRTREMSEFLSEKAPHGFNANLSLLRAYTAYIKTTKFTTYVDRPSFAQHTPSLILSALHEAIAHARELGESTAAFALLDEIDRCIPEMQKKGQVRLNVWGSSANPAEIIFRELVLDAGLAEYINHALPRQPDYFSKFDWNVLALTVASLMGDCHGLKLSFEESARMLRVLLENGCDPNSVYRATAPGLAVSDCRRTPWKDFVSWPVERGKNVGHVGHHVASGATWNSRRAVIEDLLSLMLKHGADPTVWPGGSPADVRSIPSKMLHQRARSGLTEHVAGCH